MLTSSPEIVKYNNRVAQKVRKCHCEAASRNELSLERDRIISFVKGMKPKDHLIFLYTSPEDKHFVLFTDLKAG